MNVTTTRRTALAAAALAVAAPRAWAQAPIVIKFSHVVATDTPKGKGAERFKELAEKRTNGRVKVEVYPNSQLYKDKEEMEALQLGAVQMLAPSLAKFGPLGVKEFEVFDLPYIFDSKDVAAPRDRRPGRQEPVQEAGAQGHHRPGVLGQRLQGHVVQQAAAPSRRDFKGLKMRIQSSKVLDAQMRALGAIPQVMAFSEVYQALQTGVVDGTENPPSNLYTQKMHEVQKHVTMSNHGYLGYAVIVNKKFWDGLPADIRSQLDAGDEGRDQVRQRHRPAGERRRAWQAVKATGKTEIYDADRRGKASGWKSALMPVQKEMEIRIGKATIEAVNKETGFNPGKSERTPAMPACRGQRFRAKDARAATRFFHVGDEIPRSSRRVADRHPDGAATLVIFVAVVHRYLPACRSPACRTG